MQVTLCCRSWRSLFPARTSAECRVLRFVPGLPISKRRGGWGGIAMDLVSESDARYAVAVRLYRRGDILLLLIVE